MVALLALLTLGLFEPLACVLHCALWMPLHMQSTPVVQAQHQHHHTVTQPDADASGFAAASMTSLDQPLGPPAPRAHAPSLQFLLPLLRPPIA